MPINKLTPAGNYPYLDQRIQAIAQAFPEAVSDGKINWDILRQSIAASLDDEQPGAEHFGLSWPGKRDARLRAAAPSRGTLVPAPGEGVNEDATQNLFIEGDNLEVMKLLLKSYAGQVKMIYIDPPYNTGNDFIYNDNFTDSLETYLDYTGARGEGGELLTTNTRADGRFHSKWLSMMYPRLRLANQLLADDGLIFISIDNNELHNLKHLMDEIFGSDNFIEQITIISNPRGSQASKFLANVHEYLLMYSKNNMSINLQGYIDTENIDSEFPFEDENGKYRLLGLRQRGGAWRRTDRPNLFFPIYINPLNGSISIERKDIFSKKSLPKRPSGEEGRWTWSREKCINEIDQLIGKQVNRENEPDFWDVFRKDYATNLEGQFKGSKPKSVWSDKELNYQFGRQEIKKLFDEKDIFDFPKSPILIKKQIEMISIDEEENFIFLDFFAGSCTSAQSIIEFNFYNNKQVRFILIQFPEEINENSEAYREGYKLISEIGKERIRRVIASIQGDETIDDTLKQNSDLGFKVFKLTRSHYKHWQEEDMDAQKLETLFDATADPLIDGWKPENLFSEILLLEGFPLTSKIDLQEERFPHNEVNLVSAPAFCEHNLLICLDTQLNPLTVDKLAMGEKDIFICLDSALTDQLKARLQDRFNVHVI